MAREIIDYQGYYTPAKNECLDNKYVISKSVIKTNTAEYYSAMDMDSGSLVTVKIFRSAPESELLCTNEIVTLKKFHNCVHFVHYLGDFKHLGHSCLVTTHVEYVFEACAFEYEVAEYDTASDILLHCVRTLRKLHSHNILHGDIKPSSIGVGNDYFTIGFEYAREYRPQMTERIQSLHYRAPEVLLGLPYDKSVEIWSLGCIAFEAAIGYTLFHGTSELDQICKIIEVLGPIPNHMIESSPRKDEFFDYHSKLDKYVPKKYYSSRYIEPGCREIKSLILDGEKHNDFYDIVKKLLKCDPRKRPSIQEIRQDEFLIT